MLRVPHGPGNRGGFQRWQQLPVPPTVRRTARCSSAPLAVADSRAGGARAAARRGVGAALYLDTKYGRIYVICCIRIHIDYIHSYTGIHYDTYGTDV